MNTETFLRNSRIEWKHASMFLLFVWCISAIDESWIVAAGWTAIILGYDMLVALLLKVHLINKKRQG